jgi:DNA-binding HxlR family transcriptional regulator
MASAMKSVASRFSALEAALRGITSNLLAERLRALKTAGVVTRMSGSPAGYQLTPRGAELASVMRELIGWGGAEMRRGVERDVYRNRWFAQAVEALLKSETVSESLVFGLQFTGGGDTAVLIAEPETGVRVLRGADADNSTAHAVITGDPQALVDLLSGAGHVDGLEVSGTLGAVGRLRALLARAARDHTVAGNSQM